MQKENVVILGASDNSSRYSYMAMKLLEEHGHRTILVHPRLKEVEGRQVFENISLAKAANSLVVSISGYFLINKLFQLGV